MNHEKTNPDAARETTGAEIDKSELEIDAVITVGVWLGAAADVVLDELEKPGSGIAKNGALVCW